MTPELRNLIEAVGEWRERYYNGNKTQEGDARLLMASAYDAYVESISTPPDGLPEAPQGQKWTRVELVQGESRLFATDYVDRGASGADACGHRFSAGMAWGRGEIWRLVPDPDADSLEKIAEDVDKFYTESGHRIDLRELRDRLRALIAKEKKS